MGERELGGFHFVQTLTCVYVRDLTHTHTHTHTQSNGYHTEDDRQAVCVPGVGSDEKPASCWTGRVRSQTTGRGRGASFGVGVQH